MDYYSCKAARSAECRLRQVSYFRSVQLSGMADCDHPNHPLPPIYSQHCLLEIRTLIILTVTSLDWAQANLSRPLSTDYIGLLYRSALLSRRSVNGFGSMGPRNHQTDAGRKRDVGRDSAQRVGVPWHSNSGL